MDSMDNGLTLQCGDCGAHYKLDASGDIAGAACEDCGGTRFFRNQPSPTNSDGTLRNMVDSDSQKDQGGNPLGEGTIMGTDGEQSLKSDTHQRDNFMHGSVQLSHRTMRPKTLNMEPYPTLWSDEHVAGTAHTAFGLGDIWNGVKDVATNPYVDMGAGAAGMLVPGLDFGPAEALEGAGVAGAGEAAAGAAGAADAAAGAGVDAAAGGADAAGAGADAAGDTGEGAQAAGSEPKPANGEEGSKSEEGSGGTNGEPQQDGEQEQNPEDENNGESDESANEKNSPSLMNRLFNGIKGPLAFKGLEQLIHPGQQGAPGGNTGYATPNLGIQNYGSTDLPMILVADLETPHSVKSVDEQHDDPEKQDQKEFNDGDKSPSNLENPNNEDSGVSGEDGVRDATPGYGFGPNSPGLQRLNELMPLVMHYITNGLSGADDPVLQGLHQALEQENPGYLENEHPEGPKMVEIMIQNHKSKQPKSARLADTLPSGLPATPTPAGLGMQNQQGGICPLCGGTLDAQGRCPQCGYQSHNSPVQPHVTGRSANHQGPVTQEQKDAIKQLVDAKPELFGDILNQIQNVPNTAPLVDPSQAQPAPQPPMENPQGAMPMPDPSQPGGGGQQPMQPMAHTHNSDYGNMGLDILQQISQLRRNLPADVQAQIDQSLRSVGPQQTLDSIKNYQQFNPYQAAKTADANNAIPRCPKCNSATTSYMDGGDDTNAQQRGRCHSCQTVFEIPKEKVDKAVVLQSSHVLAEIGANPVSESMADQDQGRPNESQSLNDPWVDASGQPLVEGQIYSLKSPSYPVPDEVQVVSKKPHSLGVKLVGEFSNILNAGDPSKPDFEISAEDLINQKYSFEPDQSSADQQGQEPPLGGTPGMEQIPQQEPTTDEIANTYPNGGGTTSAVRDDDMCHKCGGGWVEHTASSSTRTMHECARCGTAWETEEEDDSRTAAGLDWIMNDGPQDDDFFSEMERAKNMRAASGSRNLSDIASKDERLNAIRDVLDTNASQRTAGRHYNPREQRALINEQGTARNSDMLDLEGTHYVTRYDETGKANALNVLDEHLVFGL